jgi:hypothetical protein
MDMITGIIIGIVITLVVGVVIALNLPRQKGDPDSYGRQQWNFDDENE